MSKLIKVITVAAAGFVAGVLLAPKSGKATLKDVKNKVTRAKKLADEKTDELEDVVRSASESVLGTAGKEARGMEKSTRKSAKVVTREAKTLSAEAKSRANRVAAEAKRATSTVKRSTKKVAH